ncbi:T6SS effector BTH_I2691 family protein [Burkholderia glumae]|uniref:Toxin VasX N-terminal region domain-containing protein n=4 Tax=Burkholderia glumae TaxID=337 RepID=A0AAP9XYU8_BURGL|nr:T6SS effector BTH_I2691 family protein [Burkholderia glumae]ACR31495.1 Hypothetical protein bglu_2g11010 [Burkholderia glumae BGR1]AJY62703.1 hypothetical protein KS03_4819 [Burkholderia glumae LMG 2196 = ATCC 33617]KHJ61175.1 hypothetical protein NCPPB3923_20165 [Burkholderia glumae]MCM2485342.1 hypothetical protein [Burkholderia glumae]MCM2511036.1 hypothetical protein [Burkholderia glumae]
MATNSNPPCKNCEKGGLPILPVRYTVLPKTVSAKFPAGITGEGITGVTLTQHNYGLRTLREGWLYLFYSQGPRGKNYWEAYRITADGRLWKQSIPLPVVPVKHPACAKSGHAVPMDIIAIEQPELCTEVYIAFSEHSWHTKIFDLYAQNATLRKERMQCIEPAKWIAGGTNKHAAIATEQSVDAIVEYMPGFNPALLKPSMTQTLSDETGRYNPQLVKREATRYALHIRQATPDSASKALVDMMHDVGKISAARHYPPMVLALWDAIGNVHELNGFRNDAGSMLGIYVRERAVQIDAMQSIDAAEVAVRNGAVAFKSKLRSAMQAGIEGLMQSGGGDLPVLQTPEQMEASQRRIEQAGVVSPSEAKAIGEAEWPKYLKKLNPSKLASFRPWFASVQTAVAAIQANRSADVGAWLKAPLLLTTLHDYYEEDVRDGKAFETVVSEAISGLPSEAKGEKLVSDLVDNMDPTHPASLVWRAFAGNQKQPKIEIKQLLADVSKYKATPMEVTAEWAEKIAKSLEKVKTFWEFWEKMKEVKEHENPISKTEAGLKALHIDKLMTAIAPSLFKWTGFGLVGNCAGTYLLRGAMLMRVGISHADAIELVKAAVRTELPMFNKLKADFLALRLRGIPAANAYAQALDNLASDERGQLLRAKWNAVRVTSEGAEAAGAVRLAGTLAFIEVVSFAAALSKTDKSDEDYASLVASGFSATSACLDVSTRAVTALAEDAARTLANLKAVTGYLSGASSLIGAVLDVRSGNKEADNGRMALESMYYIKSLLGFVAFGTNLLTAMTSSAPLIARITGGRGIVWVGKAGAGISGATAYTNEVAKPIIESVTARERDAAVKKAANIAFDSALKNVATDVAVATGERAFLISAGRVVLFLAGWEVAAAATLIQFLIWYLSDNGLQTWMEKCWFGRSPNSPVWSAGKQHEEFQKALSSSELQVNEGLE